MTLFIALTGFIISLVLGILRIVEFLNENKKLEVYLSWGIDEQWIDIDNPSKKQIIVSYWDFFWKTKNDKRTLSDNFPPEYKRFILKPYSGQTLEFEEPFLLNLEKPSEIAELYIALKIAGKRKMVFKKINLR